MRYLSTREANFSAQLDAFFASKQEHDLIIERNVRTICETVKKEGDRALLAYSQRFDHINAKSVQDFLIAKSVLKEAFLSLSLTLQDALMTAKKRIFQFHQKQKQHSWQYQDEWGNWLGQKITPITRVGLYVPGGKAAYPSSVLMNALPAKVAGVPDITMVVHTPDGEKNAAVLAAAYVCDIDRVFTIGGAQAIAALAYGTETIPKVDKITGPGNAYVAAAKKEVFGHTAIDMIAGPSEILVISDGSTPVEWIVEDLFSQAEHDEEASAILISPNKHHIQGVQQMIDQRLKEEPRQQIIKSALKNRGLIIEVQNLEEACAIADHIAPEHLELSIEKARDYVEKIHNAGALFIGPYSTESVGDYCAGPNHVLPTARTARFSSPLGTYDFQKRISLIEIQPNAKALFAAAETLAQEEGLYAHAQAARLRKKAL